jgi:hypothetical protein
MSQTDLTNPGGIYEERPRSNVYTAMLGVALVAMILASALLALELKRYEFDYKGERAKAATVESLPAKAAPAADAGTQPPTPSDSATPPAPAAGASPTAAPPVVPPAVPPAVPVGTPIGAPVGTLPVAPPPLPAVPSPTAQP